MNVMLIKSIDTLAGKLQECEDPTKGSWEELEDDHFSATCLAFNRRGNFLAVGESDGRVALWDFSTLRVLCCVLDPESPEALPRAEQCYSPRKVALSPRGSERENRRLPSNSSPLGTAKRKPPPLRQSEPTRFIAVEDIDGDVLRKVRKVVACSWSSDSRYLHVAYKLSGASARVAHTLLLIWDVAERKIVHAFSCQYGASGCKAIPNNHRQCILCLEQKDPLLVDFAASTAVHIELGGYEDSPADLPTEERDKDKEPSQEKEKKPSRDTYTVCEVFQSSRKAIFSSTKGFVCIVDLNTLQVIEKKSFPGSGTFSGIPVANISLSSSEEFILITSVKGLRRFDLRSASDGAMLKDERIYTIGAVRGPWGRCAISHDGSRVLGTPSSRYQGSGVYVWSELFNKEDEGDGGRGREGGGGLPQMVEEVREGVLDLQWHPLRPLIAAVSNIGHLYVLEKPFKSDFAGPMFPPGYQLVDDNVMYAEREDEFDAKVAVAKVTQDESAPVDVQTIDEQECSLPSSSLELRKLPVAPLSNLNSASGGEEHNRKRERFDALSLFPRVVKKKESS